MLCPLTLLGANLDTSMPIRPSLLVAAIVAGTLCAEGAGEKGFSVAGYLPEWRYLQWTKGEHVWRCIKWRFYSVSL